jgi:hypothetical protein
LDENPLSVRNGLGSTPMLNLLPVQQLFGAAGRLSVRVLREYSDCEKKKEYIYKIYNKQAQMVIYQ